MAAMSLPPGFRFHPTDEELVGYYLERKISGGTIELEIIPEVDLYNCEPWELPEKSFLPGKDMEWYFYSRRDRKYPNGSRTNRATRGGYWKATGKDRSVLMMQHKISGTTTATKERLLGMKKTLVYYKGRAPHGIRTNWVMHEYRLLNSPSNNVNHNHPPSSPSTSSLKDSYALCRVFKKSIQIPKTKAGKTEQDNDTIDHEKDCLGSADNHHHEIISQKEAADHHNIHDHDDMELQITSYMINHEEDDEYFHGVSKSDTCSDSDVTQGGTPNQTPFHDDDNQTARAHYHCTQHHPTALPFTSDEANSSPAAAHHFPQLNSSSSSIFQDIEMSSLNYQAPYPPLELDDFPHINIFSASASSSSSDETKKPESNMNSTIDDFINFYDQNKCKGGGQINGALEDIFSLCSSSSQGNNNHHNNPISLSMHDN